MSCLYISTLYYVPIVSSYVCDHAALPRMSANADFYIPLKCLASGKKSVEQQRPCVPQQTSALELLVFYCFRILFVYPCALYYAPPPPLAICSGGGGVSGKVSGNDSFQRKSESVFSEHQDWRNNNV